MTIDVFLVFETSERHACLGSLVVSSVFIVTDEVVRLRLIAASGSFVVRLRVRVRVRVAGVLLEHHANASVVPIDLQMTFCTTPVCDFPLDFHKLNVLHARARHVL